MKLLPVQFLLLGLLITFIAYIFRFRTPLRDRMLYFIIACCGIVAVLVPTLTSRVAHLVGIGRGTDLILYLFVMFGLLYVVSLSTHLRRIEQQITALTRQSAIAEEEISRIMSEQPQRVRPHAYDPTGVLSGHLPTPSEERSTSGEVHSL